MTTYAVRITPEWDGTYCIEEDALDYGSGLIMRNKVATSFKSIEEAEDRTRFMGRDRFLNYKGG